MGTNGTHLSQIFKAAQLLLLLVCIIFNKKTKAKENDNQNCAPSSCGNISNISYPFRLENDPNNCGDSRYNLSCEKNQTILYLYSGKYYVHSINYTEQTIQVVDFGIHNQKKTNCSSSNIIPHYSLSHKNFSNGDPYQYWIGENISEDKYVTKFIISEIIAFLDCDNQINSTIYWDTSSCYYNSSSNIEDSVLPRLKSSYSYVIYLGFLSTVSQLEDSCGIVSMYLTSSKLWSTNMYNESKTYNMEMIHNDIVNGFFLSWMQPYPGYGNTVKRWGYCYSHNYANPNDTCVSFCPLGLPIAFCGLMDHFFVYLRNNYKKLIKYTVISLVTSRFTFGMICLVSVWIYTWRRRHVSLYNSIEEFLQSQNNLMPIRYSYSEIKRMTKNFKDKLGEGGYGCVYKGKLSSGHFVAVKILGKSKANGQEFINEVATIGRIHHFNVVRLVGFCVEKSKNALIYEFMPNGSLEKYVYHSQLQEMKSGSLDCTKMFEISLGIARGIEYLHRGCDIQILHFDIKPHNILLDDKFNPKVSDFGLARLCPSDKNNVTLTAARGTIGYIAPELFYKNIGGVSYKADVYSFGMLLMEMASRRKNFKTIEENSSETYFPLWVHDQLLNSSSGDEKDIIMYENEQVPNEQELKIIKKMVIVALWCIQLKPSDRPSMNNVIEMLERDVEYCLELPPKPSLYPQENFIVQNSGSTSHSTWSTTISSHGSDSIENNSLMIPNQT